MDENQIKFYEKQVYCINPYDLHAKYSKTVKDIRHLREEDITKLGCSSLTTKMKICGTCRTSNQFKEGKPSKYAVQSTPSSTSNAPELATSSNSYVLTPSIVNYEPQPTTSYFEPDIEPSVSNPVTPQNIANRILHNTPPSHDRPTETDHPLTPRVERLRAEARLQALLVSPSLSEAASVSTIPSTESLREVQVTSNYETVKKIAQVINVDAPGLSALQKSDFKHYLSFENAVVQKLRSLCGFLHVPTDLDKIINNIKEQIDTLLDRKEKQKFLNLLPDWSKAKIAETFKTNVSRHTINTMERFTANTNKDSSRRPGNQPLSEEMENRIINTYLRDDVSRLFPGMKDVISVKQPDGSRVKEQKRLLLYPEYEIHQMFLKELQGALYDFYF